MVTVNGSGLQFTWAPPTQPNGVITHYTLYVNDIALYNGSNTQYT